jgi:hypothetical protein
MLRERALPDAAAPRSSVAISFGSPASEGGVTRLDLNNILIRYPPGGIPHAASRRSMVWAG